MHKTEFLTPTEKGALIKASYKNKEALAELLFELDRLENRIRSLEIVLEVAESKSKTSTNPNWEKILPIISKHLPL